MDQLSHTTGDEWRHPRTERVLTVVGVGDRTVTYRTHGMEFQATTDGFEQVLHGSSLVRN